MSGSERCKDRSEGALNYPGLANKTCFSSLSLFGSLLAVSHLLPFMGETGKIKNKRVYLFSLCYTSVTSYFKNEETSHITVIEKSDYL